MQKYTATQVSAEVFCKYPTFLSLNEKYINLTSNDRLGYMFIKERYSYALMQGWVDEEGYVFVYYTLKELTELLHIKRDAVITVKKHLEKAKLIQIKKQGFNPKTKKNAPDRIYLLQPEYNAADLISQSSQVSSLQQSDSRKNRPNIDNTLDTTKIHEDTQLDFSSSSYTQAEIDAQNKDLIKNAPEFLTQTDNNENMILNKDGLQTLARYEKDSSRISKQLLDKFAELYHLEPDQIYVGKKSDYIEKYHRSLENDASSNKKN